MKQLTSHNELLNHIIVQIANAEAQQKNIPRRGLVDVVKLIK